MKNSPAQETLHCSQGQGISLRLPGPILLQPFGGDVARRR
jgi:hypothetical protein